MKQYPCILSIAGSDCSGGAGIQADIKTISALGCYAESVITAVTAQNTHTVTDVFPIPAPYVRAQLEAVLTDIHPIAVKVGMISDIEIVKVIAIELEKYRPKYIVVDPVMVSTSGCRLIEYDAIRILTNWLMPMATVITPNLNEASMLTGKSITNVDAMKEAAKELLKFHCKAVLVKGGHLNGTDMCDVLQIRDEKEPRLFASPHIESRNTHGTGCTLSSAIATYLALGDPLPEAVRKAKEFVYQGILNGKDVQTGKGHGPLNHFHHPMPMRILEEEI